VTEPEEKKTRRPHALIALIPVVFLIGALWLSVVHFRALELTAHVPLIMAAVVASPQSGFEHTTRCR